MLEHAIPSRQLEVWRRLYTRYSLEPWPASVSPDVSKTVQPITNADDLLAKPRAELGIGTAAGTGDLQVAVVPADKRWELEALLVRLSSGDSTMNRIEIRDESEGTNIIIKAFSSSTSEVLPAGLGRIILDPGDSVRVNIDAFTGGGDWHANMWVTESDIF